MSTIINAINSFSAEAFKNNQRQAAAIATFSKKDGQTVPSLSKKKEEALSVLGINKAQYNSYASAVLAVYWDSIHLATYKGTDKEQKVRDFFYTDLAALVKAIMGDDYELTHIFTDNTMIRDFEEHCVAICRDFEAGESNYEVVAAQTGKFVKWIEHWFSANAAGAAMLSLAERDRRNNIRRFSIKVNKLTKTVAAGEEALAKADEAYQKAVHDKDAKPELVTRREKAVMNVKTELENNKAALEKAKEALAAYQAEKTEYSPNEIVL